MCPFVAAKKTVKAANCKTILIHKRSGLNNILFLLRKMQVLSVHYM